jgi:hypothetical protein
VTPMTLWQRWCAGPYRPRRRGAGHPAMAALGWVGVVAWWGIPFMLIVVPAIIFAVLLN